MNINSRFLGMIAFIALTIIAVLAAVPVIADWFGMDVTFYGSLWWWLRTMSLLFVFLTAAAAAYVWTNHGRGNGWNIVLLIVTICVILFHVLHYWFG
ncbi:MAG: hypothetical protein FWB72_07250 [Firmicutes bacterium]|nr:hypothetical protein [Bacillota bacterium]